MTPPRPVAPLPTFTPLGPSIFLHDPSTSFTPLDSPPQPRDNQPPTGLLPPPNLILLLTWGSAPPRAIAKYALLYTNIYPRARILLLTTTFVELLLQSFPSRLPVLDPAISAIRSLTQRSPRARVLAHIFSNGGSYKLLRLATAYRERVGMELPMTALIIDSGPGLNSVVRGARAVSYALPKTPLLFYPSMALVWMHLLLWRLLTFVTQQPSWVERMYARMNDRIALGRAPRLYIYSKEDDLVRWEDVRRHAEGAREGGRVAREEIFVGSGHVAHLRLSPERYERVVREFWEEMGTGEV